MVKNSTGVENSMRLKTQYVEQSGQHITVDNVYSKYTDECKQKGEEFLTRIALGRIIHQQFSSVKSEKVRSQGGFVRIYRNLCIKQPTDDVNLNGYSSIDAIITGSGFKVLNKSPQSVTFAFATEYICNGQYLILQFELTCGGILRLNVNGRTVNNAKVQLPDKVDLDNGGNILYVLEILKSLSICRGYPVSDDVENVHPSSSIEIWTQKNGKSSYAGVRSPSCLLIKTNTSGICCASCRKRRNYIHDKPEQDGKHLQLSKEKNNDLDTIIKSLDPTLPDNLKLMISSQLQNFSCSDIRGRRWDRRIISVCLSIWARSPKAYTDLRNSGYAVLPSERLLRFYKNSFHQTSGIDPKQVEWMLYEARRLAIPSEGYYGILAMDEMTIQEDLQIDYRGGTSRLVGFVDMGEESSDLTVLKSDKEAVTLAKEVFQINFVGDTGFRFPLSHFPSAGGTAPEFFINMWKTVSLLKQHDFHVNGFVMDGSSNNRSFLKMHFPDKDPTVSNYSVINPFDQKRRVVIMMDPSHQLKKIRNSLLSSKADGSGSRMMQLRNVQEGYILWDYWEEAYKWDLDNIIRIHRHLVYEAVYPTDPEKMRNNLANAALNADMLFLMEMYQQWLGDNGNYLDATIQFLKQTSILVANFLDPRPIRSTSDIRLKQNQECLAWFSAWENSVLTEKSLTPKDKTRCLMTKECREDLQSTVVGFEELCRLKLRNYPNSYIKPNLVNTDVVENLFCQQRAVKNGPCTNPNYQQYARSMNTVILGQSLKSKKSNAYSTETAQPYSFHTNQRLNTCSQKTTKKIRI